jgi:hypothetical protein
VHGLRPEVEVRRELLDRAREVGGGWPECAVPREALLGRRGERHLERHRRAHLRRPPFGGRHEQRAERPLEESRDGSRSCAVALVDVVAVEHHDALREHAFALHRPAQVIQLGRQRGE